MFPTSGKAVDGSALQYNIVRVNGQRSAYVPILKQGGDTNTIAVVNGIKSAIKSLRDIPSELKTHVVFDQSLFVKQAISTVLHEGGVGLVLDGGADPYFSWQPPSHGGRFSVGTALGDGRSLPASSGNGTINSMVLSGLALAFSRLIDNSVVVLENIFRHIELGETPAVAAERGANEVGLAVLAITIVTVVVFFPVTLLFGVSKYLFTALALAVVFSLFASYFVAVSVVPLYCAYFPAQHACAPRIWRRPATRRDRGWRNFTRGSMCGSSACWPGTIAGFRRFWRAQGDCGLGFLGSLS